MGSRGFAPAGDFDRALVSLRIVSFALFLTLIWKLKTYRWLLVVYQNVPIQDPFFPPFFRSELVLALAYGLACAGALWGILGRDLRLLRWQTSGLCAALAVLCLHQGSFNDVTFCTAFWSAGWCWWYVRRMDRDPPDVLYDKSAFLAQAILAVILLGGAVGKLTPGYWSGAVFYDIYFVDRDYWTFNLLRVWFAPDQLRELAVWYSRFVIVTESLGAVAVLILPRRAASWTAIAILLGIALLSNLQLFSVLSCLLGLAAIGLRGPRLSEPNDRGFFGTIGNS